MKHKRVSHRSSLTAFAAAVILSGGGLSAQTIESTALRADLASINEVPVPEGVTGKGWATVWVRVQRDTKGAINRASVEFETRYTLSAPGAITSLRIHRGKRGYAGAAVLDSGFKNPEAVPDSRPRSSVQRRIHVSDKSSVDVITAVLANPENYYVNLQSTANPDGLLRGQLVRANVTTIETVLSAANLVPADTTEKATALIATTVLAGRDSRGVLTSAEVSHEIAYSGVAAGTRLLAADLYAGASSANGSSVVASPEQDYEVGASGAGSMRVVADVSVENTAAAAAVAGFEANPNNYYVNLRTSKKPRGALRGQLRPTGTIRVESSLSSKAQVPSLDVASASATSQMDIQPIRDNNGDITAARLNFLIAYSFAGAVKLTGFALHEGPAGQNGLARVSSGLEDSPVADESGSGMVSRSVLVDTKDGLAALNALVRSPERYYLNLKTDEYPNGVLRAQMGTVSSALPAITGAGGLSGGTPTRTARPGGQVQILGRDLARMQGFSVSIVSGNMPLVLNGTSVTIAGLPAAVLSVAADSITAIVPSGIHLGRAGVLGLPVVVRTVNGASNAGTILIARSGSLN